MSVCNRVQVTKNDQHFIRLMSMMEERKDSTQTNILKFFALCDILQIFKSRHQITIRHCVVCPDCPSGVAVPCCPIGEYAQPSIFGDTLAIGMPPRPAPY